MHGKLIIQIKIRVVLLLGYKESQCQIIVPLLGCREYKVFLKLQCRIL
jgi:hypothetical protein